MDQNFGTQVVNIKHTAHSYLKLFTKQCTMLNSMEAASFQEIQGIWLLSMHKSASPEGHNFSEGEFLFQELTGENPAAGRQAKEDQETAGDTNEES